MTSLSNTEIGSIVYSMIAGITDSISGILTNIVDNNIYFASQLTGNSISVSAVSEAYQPGVISLSAANVLELMESQGLGTKAVSIGELSITKGIVEGTSKALREDGIFKLKVIGERISSYQTWS